MVILSHPDGEGTPRGRTCYFSIVVFLVESTLGIWHHLVVAYGVANQMEIAFKCVHVDDGPLSESRSINAGTVMYITADSDFAGGRGKYDAE